MEIEILENKILKRIVKESMQIHTLSSLAESMNVSRPGIWKSIKKLESKKIIVLEKLGKGKTGLIRIGINWDNPVTEKILDMIITQESIGSERWRDNFKELKDKVYFLTLFGSILTNPKEANDIDILVLVKDKKQFKIVEEIIMKIQISQIKKIHYIDITQAELKSEIKKSNSAYMDALKKGVVLFGQENYIKFIKELQSK